MIELYDAIIEKLTDRYDKDKITKQSMQEDEVGSVGVYLYESSNDEETLDGETVYESIKAHIQINTEASEDGIQTALKNLRHFVKRLENERSIESKVLFVMCQHVGPKAVCIGKNGYNIPVCVCNIDIKYILKD